MTAEPVQVLVTIHPPEGTYADWVQVVHGILNEGWPLLERRFECDLVPSQPHGEAKAHREAAETGLEASRLASSDSVALAYAAEAIAHALLALGERP